MKRTVCAVLLALVLVTPGALFSQEVLTNDSIIKLVKSGIGEQIVVSMIRSQPGNYTTGADAIVALAKAGVSDKIIAEMIAKKSGSAPTPAPTAAPPAATDASAASGTPTFAEIGVYYKKDNQWTELLPEVVNWKTGGTIKNVASVGVVKKDVNGNISANSGLEITKTGKVFGDIVSDKLIVDEGATYKGKVTLETTSSKKE